MGEELVYHKDTKTQRTTEDDGPQRSQITQRILRGTPQRLQGRSSLKENLWNLRNLWMKTSPLPLLPHCGFVVTLCLCGESVGTSVSSVSGVYPVRAGVAILVVFVAI